MAMSANYNLSVGQRVQVLRKHTGVLRYIGKVPFLQGVSAGVEFDEDVGENDGSVDNVRYFFCRENHGYFCPISNIVNEQQLTTVKVHELSVDPKTSEDLFLTELSDDSKIDLDDSLGILDLDAVLGKSSEEDIGSEEILVHYPLKEYYSENLYSLGHATHSSAEQRKLNVTEVISSPEESSLNLREVIDSSEIQFESFNLNVAQFGLADEQWDLKTTHVLNRTIEIEKASFDEKLPRIGGSPLRKTASSPKRASTPKRKANYTFSLDEDSDQNFSPIPPLEKTTVKYDAVKGKIVCSERVDPNQDNIVPSKSYTIFTSDANEDILNVTCNIKKPGDSSELNKTKIFPYSGEPDTKLFPDVISDVAFSSEDHGGEELQELNKTFTNFVLNTSMPVLKESKKTVDEFKNDLDITQTLNTTYEKIDNLNELLKFKKVSKITKPDEVNGTRSARKSRNTKHMDHNPSIIVCNSKYSEFDKKKVRKCMSPDFVQKQDGSTGGANPKSKASLVRSPKKSACGKSKEMSSESMKTKCKSLKSERISASMPKLSSTRIKESGREEQKFSLDETINLTESTSSTVKKVLEKTKVSKRLSVAERETSKFSRIPSSLVRKPCSNKIEESVFQEKELKTLEKETIDQEVILISKSRSSSTQTGRSEATLERKKSISSIAEINESSPVAERRAFEKSKRHSVAKLQSQISHTPSSLVPIPSSSKIKDPKSTAQKEETLLIKTKETNQPELAEKAFDKAKRPSRRFSEVKSDISRPVTNKVIQNLSSKTALPVVRKKMPLKYTTRSIHETRMLEKRVLSPINQHIDSGLRPSSAFLVTPKISRKQSLGSETIESVAAPGPSVGEMAMPVLSQSQKSNEDSAAVRSREMSFIPLPVSRKKKDKEKLNVIPEKKKRNFR